MKSSRSESVNTETLEGITFITTGVLELSGFITSNFFVVERVISGDNRGSESLESSSDHLSDSDEELKFFLSGGSSGSVLSDEGITHLDGEGEEVSVSGDLLFGLGDEELFFEDPM